MRAGVFVCSEQVPRLVGLSNRQLSSHVSGSYKNKTKMPAGSAPSEG